MSFDTLSLRLLNDKFRLCLDKAPSSFHELREIAESQFILKNKIMTYLNDQGEFLKITNDQDYINILRSNLESDCPVIVISFEKPKILDKIQFNEDKVHSMNRPSPLKVDSGSVDNSPAKSKRKLDSYKATNPIKEEPLDMLGSELTSVDIQIIGDLPDKLKERPNKTLYFRWKIKNICADTLPKTLKLIKIEGNLDGLPSNIPEMKPDELTELSIKVVTPRHQGYYRSKWQIFNKSVPMGSHILIELDVVEPIDNVENIVRLMEMGFNEHSVRRALIDTNGNFEAALELIISAQDP